MRRLGVSATGKYICPYCKYRADTFRRRGSLEWKPGQYECPACGKVSEKATRTAMRQRSRAMVQAQQSSAPSPPAQSLKVCSAAYNIPVEQVYRAILASMAGQRCKVRRSNDNEHWVHFRGPKWWLMGGWLMAARAIYDPHLGTIAVVSRQTPAQDALIPSLDNRRQIAHDLLTAVGTLVGESPRWLEDTL